MDIYVYVLPIMQREAMDRLSELILKGVFKMLDTHLLYKEVKELGNSNILSELEAHKFNLTIFNLMRIETKELIHSNILAELLNPNNKYNFGRLFLDKFLNYFDGLKPQGTAKLNPVKLKELTQAKLINIAREYNNFDIVLNFLNEKTVIVIENKIRHHEREKQISDYQKILPTIYKNYSQYIIIFLTPSGRISETLDQNNKQVLVILASYSDIVNILNEILPQFKGETEYFLRQFKIHLEGDILMQDSVLKEKCREIFVKYPKAYSYLVKNQPGLEDILEDIKNEIKAKYNDIQFRFIPYPKGQKITEFQVSNDAWMNKDVHIKTYIVNDNTLSIFAAVPKSKINDTFKLRFGIDPHPIIRDLSWSWYNILEGEPTEFSTPDGFGKETMKNVVEEISKIFDKINPYL